MPPLPVIPDLTGAPLRNRVRLVLAAPVHDVWALLGDLARFPEYSAGLERVDPVFDGHGRCIEYVCHFRPAAEGEPGIVDRNIVRWLEPGRGYASSGTPASAFGLSDDLHLVSIDASPEGTLVTCDEYFQADDVDMMRTNFDEALTDMAAQLVARFGGRLIERYVRDDAVPDEPTATVARLTDAVNRGDLDAAVMLYEPEAVLVGQPGRVARGHDQIRKALREFIELRPTLTTVASLVLDSDDLALYFGRWRLTGMASSGAPVAMDGESADVLRRDTDGRWRIALDDPWGSALLAAD